MRNNIFYWKCDCDLAPEKKKSLFFADKYDNGERAKLAHAIAERFLGCAADKCEALKADGNHFTYLIRGRGQAFFLRADDGLSDDDYMLAESAVMNLLHAKNLPVPRVFATDVSLKDFPCRYQVMEFMDLPCLNNFYKNNELDSHKIARESGKFLAALHNNKFGGFGFIDTRALAKDGSLRGLDASLRAYFNKCLQDHLAYLRDQSLLTASSVKNIESLFAKHEPLLNISRGSLLHRDFAYWNLLGTRDTIGAVIDWDDCVIGDPADDFGILNCFLEEEQMNAALLEYFRPAPCDEGFQCRIWLHTLRNMLWKAMIRHYMGYFNKGSGFFMAKNDRGFSLKDYTLAKINISIQKLESYK